MEEIRLTGDADLLLCLLYREYLQKRKTCANRDEAMFFGPPEMVQSELVPAWPVEDIASAAWELSRCGLVSLCPGENLYAEGTLLPAGVAWMEGRFGRDLRKLGERITSVLKLILG